MDMDHILQIIVVHGIALGLAMDAFAVSVVSGSIYRELNIRYAVRMAFFFGAFQAIMPLIGYAAGQTVASKIVMWDHWIAFGILSVIGGKMIYEAFKIKAVEDRPKDPSNLIVLLVLSIATSIDALAVGITLSLVTGYIFRAVATIGVVTFVISYIGYVIGKQMGHFFENKIEIIGGLILIGIGLKILISHLIMHAH
jgi:putative Mn2+ efflux pump MntP